MIVFQKSQLMTANSFAETETAFNRNRFRLSISRNQIGPWWIRNWECGTVVLNKILVLAQYLLDQSRLAKLFVTENTLPSKRNVE